MPAKHAKEKKSKELNPFVLITWIIVVFWILSFFIPSGQFERVDNVVGPESFHILQKIYFYFFEEILTMGTSALKASGSLILSMLVVGGSLRMITETGAMDLGLDAIIKRYGDKTIAIIPILCCLLGVCGSATVFISTAITLVPICIVIAQKLKLDNAVAVGLAYLGPWIGFMASPINVSTTATAQSLAGIPQFSGFGVRLVMTVIFVLILAAFMTWYCVRIRKDPSKSVMGGQSIDSLSVEANSAYAGQKFTWKHGSILLVFVAGIVYFAIGTKLWKYGPSEMAGILFVAAVFGNIVAGKSLDEGYKTFVKGGQTMVSTVLMIILASMISAILTNGLIIDTVVYYISLPLRALPKAMAAIGMFVANCLINIPIPSGSAQANVVMPIMAPLSDVLGITRQTAILAYQYGDSFTNLMNPTSAAFMGALALAQVSFKKWMKFITPLFAVYLIPIVVSLVWATATGWMGF